MRGITEMREDGLLPGFRFHPTDEELVGFYLRRKVERKPICLEIIKHVDIYKYDPWDLPHDCHESKEWYFFSLRGRKYRNSVRPNRVTGSGFWKATGVDKPICGPLGSSDIIGLKKSLVYYLGSSGKAHKTEWMMHEFRLPSNWAGAKGHEAEAWTICRIFKKNATCKRNSLTHKLESPASTTSSSSKTSSNESEGFFNATNIHISTDDDWNQWDLHMDDSPLIINEDTYHGAHDDFFENGWDEIGKMMDKTGTF